MKRGGPLRRITPLTAKTGLQRGGFLRRGAFIPKRSPITPKRPTMTQAEKDARTAVAARSAGRCEGCGTPGPTDWAHRVGRAQGGLWAPENGLALCRIRCHGWSHDWPIQANELGWILWSYQNPATEPAFLLEHGWCLLLPNGDIQKTERKKAA